MLSDYEDVVINLVEGQNYTHLQVSEYLKCQFGQKRGFGECSVRLFCKRNGIAPTGRKHRASDATLVTSVSSAIAEVCIGGMKSDGMIDGPLHITSGVNLSQSCGEKII